MGESTLKFPHTSEFGHIELSNGWTVSIQLPRLGIHADEGTAEIWAWPNHSQVSDQKSFPEDGPRGWQTPEETIRFIAEVSEFDA